MNSEKARRLLAAWICVFALVSLRTLAAEATPTTDGDSDGSGPRFISPDGRYGLLVTKDRADDSMSERVELIELATKRSLVVLNDPEAPERSDKARLDWSKDSKRVAAFTGTRVDGSTSILVREGDGFAAVKLPKLPELPNPEESAAFRKKHKFKFLKWINTGSLEFVRWLPSGDVELKYYNLVATKEGGGFRSEINATVAIDSKNRATLKKVSREETLE
jgi:hypothetical protein